MGISVKLVAIGRKGQLYFKRRPKFNVVSEWGAQLRGAVN